MTFIFLKIDRVKWTVYLGDGDIWLQLVESFSNLGLHVLEKLLPVKPAWLPNNTLKQHKDFKA